MIKYNSYHYLWQTWYNMIRRCYQEETNQFEYYGGKGITVCDRWLHTETGFEDFCKDMGDRPEGYTLDRIDIDKDYDPSNCRWSSKIEQERNKSTNRFITNKETGETKCATDWSYILGGERNTVTQRLQRGWDEQRAITEPARKYKRRKAA